MEAEPDTLPADATGRRRDGHYKNEGGFEFQFLAGRVTVRDGWEMEREDVSTRGWSRRGTPYENEMRDWGRRGELT
jgi:hypothetical protein